VAAATIEEHPFGITWVVDEAMQRACHALADGGRVWLFDPVDDEAAIERAMALGEPAAVVQLLDRHGRDSEALAERLGVPLLVVPDEIEGAPFELVRLTHNRFWREVALWWEEQSALVVPEAVGTAPVWALGPGAVGVHPLLRLTGPPRKQLRDFKPERLLVGHGPAVSENAADELAEALGRGRRDIPKLLLPKKKS
jgi:hypothetical protein